MKSFSILEAPSEKFVKLALEKMGVKLEDFKNDIHSQEDYLLQSKKYPIFVVADGVTLIQYILDKKEYPNPSPAGAVAQIFCEQVVRSAESKYESFKDSDIKDIFTEANNAVRKYNTDHGRTKETVDYWDNDLYACTAAFVVIKDGVVYWASICDSYVMHFSSTGTLEFSSPECHDLKQIDSPKYAGDSTDQIAKTKHRWSTARNGINEKGQRIGYGVVTGEPEALTYLSYGSFSMKEGDVLTLLTDGFENHVRLPDFISLFTSWSPDIESEFKELTHKKAEEDPERYGRERSIIVVKNSE